MITDRLYMMLRGTPWVRRQLKRILLHSAHRERVISRFGHKLLVDPAELHGFYLYYEREYDDHIFQFLLPRLRTFRRALDLGANIGIYTVFLAQHVARIDAFEPEPSVLACLRHNLRLNLVRNVTVHETCVGRKTGSVRFIKPDRHNKGVGRIGSGQSEAVDRPCVSLDDFFGDAIDEPCLIKMDIEGAELLAIQGAQYALANRRAPVCLLIETHPNEIAEAGGSLDALKASLDSLGLTVYGLTPDGLVAQQPGLWCRFWWAEG